MSLELQELLLQTLRIPTFLFFFQMFCCHAFVTFLSLSFVPVIFVMPNGQKRQTTTQKHDNQHNKTCQCFLWGAIWVSEDSASSWLVVVQLFVSFVSRRFLHCVSLLSFFVIVVIWRTGREGAQRGNDNHMTTNRRPGSGYRRRMTKSNDKNCQKMTD